MRIYLDNCCLNRPFDDDTQIRIALEAQAVTAILRLCNSGAWTLISSDALEFEVSQAPSGPRRTWLQEVLLAAPEYVSIEPNVESRGVELESRGFKNIDAIHIALAEAGRADCLCTCDDRMLGLARRQTDLKTQVVSPLEIVQKVGP